MCIEEEDRSSVGFEGGERDGVSGTAMGLGANLGVPLAQRGLIPGESLGKGAVTNLKAHKPAATSGGERARERGYWFKVVCSRWFLYGAGVTHPLWLGKSPRDLHKAG